MRDRSIFAHLGEEDLRTLGMEVQDLEAEAGETLYLEGDPAKSAYTLREGAVKLVKTLPNGRAQIVRLLGPGDIFGFEGLLEPRHRHSAITLSRSLLCRLDLPRMNTLSERLPAVREALMRRWFQSLRQAEDHIVELGAKNASERLTSFLIQWHGRHPAGTSVPFPFSRQDLGEFLGLSTEHVSRLMADFKRQGLVVERSGRLTLPEPERLLDYACESGACG